MPVSCVERGRWSYRSRQFASAPRAAYPELRRIKREGGGQSQVWSELSEKAERLDARSQTDAAEQMYVSHSASPAESLEQPPRQPGHCGPIAVTGGRLAAPDYAGRPCPALEPSGMSYGDLILALFANRSADLLDDEAGITAAINRFVDV